MKLWKNAGEIGGEQSMKLQGNLEDCDKHGAYNLYFFDL